jgi:hypothetical protein
MVSAEYIKHIIYQVALTIPQDISMDRFEIALDKAEKVAKAIKLLSELDVLVRSIPQEYLTIPETDFSKFIKKITPAKKKVVLNK